MPTESARHRLVSASLCAAVVTAVGAFVLHQTLQGTSDAMSLSLWSGALMAVWIGGWFALTRLRPTASGIAPAGTGSWVSRRPLLSSSAIAAGFAIVSLVGALFLTELSLFGGDLTTATSRVAGAPLVVFLVALTTGASEELFFRIGLSRILSTRWFPVISTLAYSIVTLATGNLALTIAAVLLGATSSTALVATRRWYAPLIIHAAWTVALVGVFPLLSGAHRG